MEKINQDYMEIYPSYGKDFKTKNEVEVAFRTGKDFEGDVSVRFAKLSVRDFAPGTKVILRYAKMTKAHVVVV